MLFASLVETAFAFLAADYGFERVERPPDGVGESVEYLKDPITIAFSWYKGEIDIDFRVSLEFSAGHKIFRPYLSRTFALSEIALRQNPQAFASWAVRPHPAAYITSPDEAREFLVECARIMRQYSVPILEGQLKQLEEIAIERRARV